ncbi:MAG: FHA domain-containing protein [Thermoplasmatota archaeon]|nr:FHA domain-containing protein [Halobacteriales archaeon]
MEPSPATEVDYHRLAEFLTALAYPTRLELLRILRFPHIASDIRLSPLRVEKGENPQRSASKQTIQAHLDKLVDADLVRVEDANPGSRGALIYSVNSQKVYAVTEDLRKVSTVFAGRGSLGETTGTIGVPEAEKAALEGPRLVLVHGLYEGKTYPLGTGRTPVTIGRRRDANVSLDYDPYVSLENCVLRNEAAGWAIEDLPASKNGTTVNWELLPKSQPKPLKPGDVVGVGRSLLVFAAG